MHTQHVHARQGWPSPIVHACHAKTEMTGLGILHDMTLQQAHQTHIS